MNEKLFDLSGKTILITGGAGILGEQVSRALCEHGGRVIIGESDTEKAELVSDKVRQEGGECHAREVDITKEDSLLALKSDIKREFGDVDVLINNAAAKGPYFFSPFEKFPLEEWEYVMNVNTTGVMLGCKVFGSEMAKRGSGSIINTLSIYGIVAPDQRIYDGSEYEGHPINTPIVYSASKAAVLGITKYLAAYWGERGVRVNAVTPGGVYSGQNETFQDRYGNRAPMGRMAKKHEMNGAFIYLASDASTYVTGQNIVVDGGWTVW